MHVGSLVLALLIVSSLVGAALFITNPEGYASHCIKLIQLLQDHRIVAMAAYSQGANCGDREFVEASQGLRGVWLWLIDSAVIVLLLQLHVRNGTVPVHDATNAYENVMIQVWYSVVSIPEAVVNHACHRLQRPYAYLAFSAHCSFRLRATNLCAIDGAHQCVINNGLML